MMEIFFNYKLRSGFNEELDADQKDQWSYLKANNKAGRSMQLHIMFDVSGSMNERIFDDKKKLRTKIEIVRDNVVSYLQELSDADCSAIHLYTFSARLTCFSQNNSVAMQSPIPRAIEIIKNTAWSCSGGTKIWDSIDTVITAIISPNNEKQIIVCVTDGEDGGSLQNYEAISQTIKKSPSLELIILDVSGKLEKVAGNDDKIIKRVDREKGIRQLLEENVIINPSVSPARSLSISVPIIGVVPCNSDDFAIVRNAMQETIPYLEDLTGLRYYPVPTYLVDEYTIKSYIEEKAQKEKDPQKLKMEIIEILRFYDGATFAINESMPKRQCRGFYPKVDDPEEHECWGRHWDWEPSSKHKIFCACEGCLGIESFIENKTFYYKDHDTGGASLPEHLLLDELSKEKDNISKIEKILKALVGHLKERICIHGKGASINKECFEHKDRNMQERYKIYLDKMIPDLEVWKKHLPEKFRSIKGCVNQNGEWKSDLRSILKVFEAGLPALIGLLRQWKLLNTRWYSIARSMHTYGVYLHRDSNHTKLTEVLKKNGYPKRFHQPDIGKVLICLDHCKALLKESNDENCQDSGQGISDFYARILKSVLIHEHAHAITFEGVGAGIDQYHTKSFDERKKRDKQEYKAVSETIAEWTAMNYFRSIGDLELYEIVKNHAQSGGLFPSWPYAGALILESAGHNLPAETQFRSLLMYFRKDTKTAYKLLLSF